MCDVTAASLRTGARCLGSFLVRQTPDGNRHIIIFNNYVSMVVPAHVYRYVNVVVPAYACSAAVRILSHYALLCIAGVEQQPRSGGSLSSPMGKRMTEAYSALLDGYEWL